MNDTDSSLFSIESDDPYLELSTIMVNKEPIVDLSYLTEKSEFFKYFNTVNKGIPGK